MMDIFLLPQLYWSSRIEETLILYAVKNIYSTVYSAHIDVQKVPEKNAYFVSQCWEVAGHVAFEAELALWVDVGVSGREMGHGRALRWDLLEQSAGHSIEAAGLDRMSLQSNVMRALLKQTTIKKNGYHTILPQSHVIEGLWKLFQTKVYINVHYRSKVWGQ